MGAVDRELKERAPMKQRKVNGWRPVFLGLEDNRTDAERRELARRLEAHLKEGN